MGIFVFIQLIFSLTMAEIRPYRKLIVWQKAHELCKQTYKITEKFPQHELYSLTKQMRRSSYSIPTNIAEGNSRRTNKDKAHFFTMAMSSLEELHYQYSLSHELGYLTKLGFDTAEKQIGEVGYLARNLRSKFL